jgi:hypothetical protein
MSVLQERTQFEVQPTGQLRRHYRLKTTFGYELAVSQKDLKIGEEKKRSLSLSLVGAGVGSGGSEKCARHR